MRPISANTSSRRPSETPSHIIAPAIHRTKEQVADLFHEKHKRPRKTDIAEMTREAREMLRPHFLTADMGISGANFLVAETGTTMIVTNEGNGRMTTTLPRVHVAIAGIEKVLPTLEDVAFILRLLTRSATGQSISNYLTFTTGPKGPDDADGPEQFHIIIVDSGRTRVLGSELREALRCIRCGACMNHCPVYQNIGGHPYGWVYPGPIGSVLTPAYVGLENAGDLPNAATLCNQCGVVCPVKIPLPDLMRKLREQQVERKLRLAPRARRAQAVDLLGIASGPVCAYHAHCGAARALVGRRSCADSSPAGQRLDARARHARAARQDVPGALCRAPGARRRRPRRASGAEQRATAVSAREHILGRIREALGRNRPADCRGCGDDRREAARSSAWSTAAHGVGPPVSFPHTLSGSVEHGG